MDSKQDVFSASSSATTTSSEGSDESTKEISEVVKERKQRLLSKYLKLQYSFKEHIYAEGFFVDISDNKIVILDITKRHLIVAGTEDKVDLGAMMPLAFITVAVAHFEKRILKVTSCTEKVRIFRFCEPDDDADEIWEEFVKVIKLRKLSKKFTGKFKLQEDDTSSMVSVSILANYIGFVSDQNSCGDSGTEKQSWWTDGFTTPKHRDIENHLKELVNKEKKSLMEKNEEKKKKEISVGNLFDRVHDHHFEMDRVVDNLVQPYKYAACVAKSESCHSNISDWSTSSVDHALTSKTASHSHSTTENIKKPKKWKKILIPKSIRFQIQNKDAVNSSSLLSFCMPKAEYVQN